MSFSFTKISKTLFTSRPGWKIKYIKIPRKETKWCIKSKGIYAYLWEQNDRWQTMYDKLPLKNYG